MANSILGMPQTSDGKRIKLIDNGDGTFSLAVSLVSGGTSPGSPVNSVQFNNAGAFGGSANLTWDGTNLNVGVSTTGNIVVGAATKTAGIHIAGVGAFDVDGAGSKALMWLDKDSDATGASNYTLTNRTAGLSHPTSFDVGDSGDFFIGADGYNAHLQYSIAATQWRFGSSSLQVQSWISTLRNTAPADGDLAANEAAIWFDPTNGTPVFRVKAKQADGTVVNPGILTSAATISNLTATRIPFASTAGLLADSAGFTRNATTGMITTPSLTTTVVAVGSLPASPVEGQRAAVNDSNAVSFTAGIGSIVAAGGSTHVPVYYDGTNWRIG